jgi:hypothetical protein
LPTVRKHAADNVIVQISQCASYWFLQY